MASSCIILCIFLWTLAAQAAPPAFRYSVSTEPTSIDPARISNSESNYFIFNVMRGLYRTSVNGDVVPEMAESCRTTNSAPWITTCTLRKNARWSDGVALKAQDVVFSWRRLLSPSAKGTGVELIKSVQGAIDAHAGKIPVEQIGLKALDARTIEIRHSEFDAEFTQKLAHPSLSLVREGFSYDRKEASKAPMLGPYVIDDWTSAQKIKLRSNPHYDNHPRPPAEVLVIDDDETALGLYRAGTLSLLRRLPTHYLKSWKGTKELHFIPVARFDYIGFGPPLNEDRFLSLRQAMAQSLKYEDLKRLYEARGLPGCPGIDRRHFETVPCHEFNVAKARALLNLKEKQPPLLLAFSKLGGDDIQKGMEWAQAQWQKNLGLHVELRSVEQAVYLQMLKTSPPPLFRKGVGLDRDSCLAAVEIFLEKDPENYIQLKDAKYQSLVDKLKVSTTSAARRKACTAAVRYLIETARIIPTGPIHFAVLAKSEFTGWSISPMNQLDLRRLSSAGR
ncbi:MAG: peptide ABC transporter substrate-binding protein [Bdellovibrionales bacterium]|nr:peptide ABC transporter substrate-binding protein [Bdellovibrionales bacterium]